MYLQQKCQKQRQKTQKECRKGWPKGLGEVGGMFYIFATKLTNFLLCGDRNTRAVQKGKKNAKSQKAKYGVCFF